VTLVLLKLLLAPVLVVASSLAGRRWGPALAGTLVALPVVAGPILFITFLDHGSAFVADAAAASLLGLITLALFAVVFARLSGLLWWPGVILSGWIVCLAADFVFASVRIPPWAGLVLTLATTFLATRVMPAERPEHRQPVSLPWWDLPARAVTTGALVLTVTAAAARLGPGLTGVLAPFPIGTSVVAGFALAQGGPAAAVSTMRGVLRGLGGFAAFCFLVAVLAVPLGGAAAFTLAVAGTVVVQLLVRSPGWRE